ncbi:DUF3783 domain-containing protein [Allofournierella massiliensis]|uniref:DUF3783 domain-containing protein n=1 Tax=Allofournierella massiliensis TaxID=1650663 RepID=A0ABT7URT3_9FIRM|nr:DUF3783 domain-containing protein [Fournierella massiliensis]MDM8201592.1 DUF3783 domain-containing protein [Fournierella massiliensis]
MKARIRPLAPCALVWNYPDTEPGFAALADACRAEGLTLTPVTPADTGRTIGSLCGGPGPASAPALTGDWPAALIMNGLDRSRLDSFLTRLRAGGVSIPLKAMVTPTNQGWTLAALLAELVREREVFVARAAAEVAQKEQ